MALRTKSDTMAEPSRFHNRLLPVTIRLINTQRVSAFAVHRSPQPCGVVSPLCLDYSLARLSACLDFDGYSLDVS